MKKANLAIMIILILSVSLYSNQHFAGEGGSGIRMSVLMPDGVGLSDDDNHLPSLIQQVLTSDLSRFSAMSVLDRVALETVLHETESGIYRNEADFGRLGQIANVDYTLTGSVTRTGANYTLNIRIVGTGTTDVGVVRASFVGTSTKGEIENQIGIKRASIDLLSQMGVNLTATARTELNRAETEARQRAANALAHGHTAQRAGTDVSALSYFLQAQAFDPTLLEATNRSSILNANIRSGNIGMDVRNEIEWFRQWEARLRETEQLVHEHFRNERLQFTLFYISGINQREVDVRAGTANINIQGTYFHAHDVWLKPVEQTLQSVYDGLHATGKVSDWRLSEWPRRGLTNLNAFQKREHNFDVVFELVNDRDRVIGRVRCDLRGSFELNRSGRPNFVVNTNFGYTVNNDGSVSTTRPVFSSVNANDITDNLTIRVATINNVAAATAIQTGSLQIRAISSSDFVNNARFSYHIGELRGFVNRATRTQNLVIPATIWGDPVLSIGNGAFQNNDINNVTFPNSIISIGNDSFRSNNLTNLTLPISVTSISNNAFRENNLSSLTLPISVSSIGNDAFRQNNLTNLTLPISVSSIGINAFRNNKLTNVTIHNEKANFGNGVFWDNQFTQFSLPNRTAKSDVYVAGEEKNRAVLWVNGKKQQLSNNISSASSVFVSNGIVYVAGEDKGRATLWINGVAQTLTTKKNTSVKSMFVKGDMVVVLLSGNQIWLNGELNHLRCGGYWNSVFVAGNTIYMAGGLVGALVWDGHRRQELSIYGSSASDLFVSDGNIYVAGWAAYSKNNNGGIYFRPRVWINGRAQTLSNGKIESARSISMSKTRGIFVAGGRFNGKPGGRLWLITGQSDVSSSLRLGSPSVFATDWDTYVVGQVNGTATLWKNGEETPLTKGKSTANSIFVVE
jgi:TolB-like protein